jgi:hypothetical protein
LLQLLHSIDNPLYINQICRYQQLFVVGNTNTYLDKLPTNHLKGCTSGTQ